MRKRINIPTLVRSSNHNVNSLIVRKNKQRIKRIKRIEKTRTEGVFIRNAFGTTKRTIYIGL